MTKLVKAALALLVVAVTIVAIVSIGAAPHPNPVAVSSPPVPTVNVTTAAPSTTLVPPFTSSPQPTTATTASACSGRDPKANIYHPDRLVILDVCKTVLGTVATVRREADGDLHIGLRLDAGQHSLLNDRNRSGQNGNLVLEIICAVSVTQADAVSACASYTNQVAVPAIGQHVSVTGPYVLDTTHGWLELHPVWAWQVVRR